MKEFFPSNGYKLRTPFWTPQQARLFDRSVDATRFAAFHEPRCGKSDPMAATACYHHERGAISGVLAVTWPAGGHLGWVLDVFPRAATVPWKGLIWDTAQSTTQGWQRQFEELLRYSGLAVLSINIEALISERCRAAIGRFASARKAIMAIGDEISAIANSDARRSRIMYNVGRMPFVKFHRILDGTPTDQKGPLDFYSEFSFMGHDILGYPNEVEFRAHYAEIETKGRRAFWMEVGRLKKNHPEAQAIKIAKGSIVEEEGKRRRIMKGRDWWEGVREDDDGRPIFKHMDELWRRIDPVSDRCTFREAFPDAKDIVFAKRMFSLSPEQRRVYDQVEDEFKAVLEDGTEINAQHHLTRTLRLQQVTSNYYPDQKLLRLHEACAGMGCEACDDSGVVEADQPMRLIDAKNHPRLDALDFELAEGKTTIIWVRFVQDGRFAMEAAERAGMKPVPYFGPLAAGQKKESLDAFQVKGTAGCIVANWSRGSRAVRMDRADKQVAYSNQWSFRTRVQAQQRSEHGSKTHATSFIDLMAVDTVDDQKIVPALRQGHDVSAFVMRDIKREWI